MGFLRFLALLGVCGVAAALAGLAQMAGLPPAAAFMLLLAIAGIGTALIMRTPQWAGSIHRSRDHAERY